MGWYVYALSALFLLGGQRFLYKVAAERGQNTAGTTLVFMGTVALLSFGGLLWTEQPFRNWRFLILISLVNSVSFWLATVCHIEALKSVPAGMNRPQAALCKLRFGKPATPMRWKVTPKRAAFLSRGSPPGSTTTVRSLLSR